MVPGGDYYIWSLMSHRNCGFVKTDGRPSGGISVDIKAIGNYGEAGKEMLSPSPDLLYSFLINLILVHCHALFIL